MFPFCTKSFKAHSRNTSFTGEGRSIRERGMWLPLSTTVPVQDPMFSRPPSSPLIIPSMHTDDPSDIRISLPLRVPTDSLLTSTPAREANMSPASSSDKLFSEFPLILHHCLSLLPYPVLHRLRRPDGHCQDLQGPLYPLHPGNLWLTLSTGLGESDTSNGLSPKIFHFCHPHGVDPKPSVTSPDPTFPLVLETTEGHWTKGQNLTGWSCYKFMLMSRGLLTAAWKLCYFLRWSYCLQIDR